MIGPSLVTRRPLWAKPIHGFMCLLLICSMGVSLVGVPKAVAQTTNLIATNEIGEPLDEGITTISDNENLWAYVTSVSGSIICVHMAPVGPDASCDGGWGETAAPPFFAGLIPVALAPLKPGLWQLIAVSPLGAFGTGPVEKESQPFRITRCIGACADAAKPDPTNAKRVFQAIYDSLYTTCQLAKALGLMKTLREAKMFADVLVVAGGSPGLAVGFAFAYVGYNVANKAVNPIEIAKPKPVAFLPKVIGYPLWAMCRSFFGWDLPASPIPFVGGGQLADVPGPLAGITRWLNDPPQPYESIEQADFIDFSQFDLDGDDPAEVLPATRAIDQIRGYLAAGTTAWERFQAAFDAGPDANRFVHAQAAAVDVNFTNLRGSVISAAVQIDRLVTAIQTDGTVPDSLTQEEITAAGEAMRRIQDTGFTPAEIDAFHAVGIDDGAIIQLLDAIGGDTETLTPTTSLVGELSRLAQSLHDARDELDDFARQAAVYAGRTNQPPAASFTAEVSPGSPPIHVEFADTSTSPDLDEIISRSWDFGDGATGEGATVGHDYAQAGIYDVTLQVCDYLECAALTKRVGVGIQNASPNAVDDVLQTPFGTSGTLNVLANDSDPDGDALAVIANSQGAHGSVSCTPEGFCTFEPELGFSGNDSFDYTASDNKGGESTATVSVKVEPPPPGNQNPVAVDDDAVTVENMATQLNVLANDSDPDGDTIYVFNWSQGTNGSVGCQSTGICTYTPAPTFTGQDSFTYQMTDGRGGVAEGTVHVTVAPGPPPENRSPVAHDDLLDVFAGTSSSVYVIGNDFDPDADPLEITDFSQGAHGAAFCSGGSCSYTPEPGFLGQDAFTYTISDGRGGNDIATVSVTVRNQLPAAFDDTLVTGKGLPADVDVLANDFDPNGDPLSVTGATNGAHGTVGCAPAGTCTYTPEPGFVGDDSFTYTISDGNGGTATAIVTVTVREIVNAGPDWFWREDRPLTFEPEVTSPDPVSCTWTFGDGGTSDGCPFDHTYADTGTYVATLTVVVQGGPTVSDGVSIQVLAAEPIGGGPGVGGNGEVVVGVDVAYTTDANFDRGTFVNLNHDAPNGDQLQLNRTATTFPFVNVAASGRGTIVRIDVNTGEIVGEYLTAPENRGRDPSRTTVDQLGNVWVANRGEFGESGGEAKGSVARVAIVLGGTRVDANGNSDPNGGFLRPPFLYNTCIDQDTDGLIRTSSGLGDILPWTNESDLDTHGGVATAADECIINYVRVAGSGTRTIAVDANNDVWVGGTGDSEHEKIEGTTGQPVPGTKFSFNCGGYGGLVDRNSVLWSASGLLRYDTVAASGECVPFGAYGLGLDPQTGHVWATNFGSDVYEIAPDGTVLGNHPHGFHASQGVAVDGNGNVWVAHSLSGGQSIGHVRTDGTFVGAVPLLGGSGPTGVAVDANGKVWTANIHTSDAQRIDPEIGPVGGGGLPTGYVDLTVDLGAGAAPYNYSDMTGFVSIGATARQGLWRAVQDGGSAGTAWGSISWNTEPSGSTPAGTEIEVVARAADSLVGLASKDFRLVGNGQPFSLTGRFIEVQVTLKTTDPARSPVLSDIRIRTQVDTQRPSCRVISRTPTQLQIQIHDTGTGLKEIVATNMQNVTVDVPVFQQGTTDPVVITATKINTAQPARFRIAATDMAGNAARCTSVGSVGALAI